MIDWSIITPPLLAGLLVLASHLPLGRRVLQRGIIFIDLAVAQIAALGVLVAQNWLHVDSPLAVQLVAFLSALLGALLLYRLEARWPQLQEALIGVVFVLAASGALLVLASNPHGSEQLQELLSGQLLWVTYQQLWPLLLISVSLVLAWWLWAKSAPLLLFYLSFALLVTASVQLVGVYLVFASLIIPALVVRALPTRRALAGGYLIGALGYLLGLLASSWWDLPAGAATVWALALVALCATLWLSVKPMPR